MAVLVTSDQHSNSTVGVNPEVVDLGEEGEWRAKKVQKWILQSWEECQDWAWHLKKEYGCAELWTVLNGDVVDDPYHPTTKRVAIDKSEIVGNVAVPVYSRLRDMSDYLFLIGGTSAHAGIDHWIEEMLARSLEATPREETNTASWDHAKLEASGVLMDVCHHAETYGYLPHTERSAAVRQSKFIQDRYVAMKERVPDLAFRAHGHYFADSGIGTTPRTFYSHGWQLTRTSFGNRKGKGYFVRPLGGLVVICKDGEFHPFTKTWEPEGAKLWKPSRAIRKRWVPLTKTA